MSVHDRHRSRATVVVAAVAIAALLGSAPAAAADPYWMGPHSGHYGVHTLIDTEEYPGVTCIYDPQTHVLHKMNIRRPIVFGYDRTSGTDTQWVGWRYVIEWWDLKIQTDTYTNWHDYALGPIHKATATDQSNAQWPADSFTFGAGVGSHDNYRVSIQMLWYYPTKIHKDGRALHVVANYLGKDPATAPFPMYGFCYRNWV